MNEIQAIIFTVSLITAIPFWVLFFLALASAFRARHVAGAIPKHLDVAMDWSASVAFPFTIAALLAWVL